MPNQSHPSFRSILVLLLVAFLFPASPAAAEPLTETMDPGPFYGFWEFKEPAGDTCIVIIKRGGRMSCFWSGTRSGSQAIQKGFWVRAGDSLTANWETGYKEIFRKLGENAMERLTFDPGEGVEGEPVVSVRGVRIDSRIPGSLTTDREVSGMEPESAPDPQAAPALPLRNAYIGYWKVDQSSGILGIGGAEPQFYLHLARSGNASVALRDWEGDQAVRGKWRVDGEQVIVTWPNNRRDVLAPVGEQGYQLKVFRPKDDLTDRPREISPAVKIPATEAERYFEAGNLKRLTVVDIRGTWIPEDPEERGAYISIEGWGNAYRYPSATGGTGTDPGKWRLQNDRVVITWVDGSKDVLRIAIPNMVRESYAANEPRTGTPFRSYSVIQSDQGNQGY
jgi:hypothetical protein